ncbi:MAG: TolC family protein [Gammaproteobacteria bacterium]|nr:TolC family protein [Gammaproteobacteria bacterium]
MGAPLSRRRPGATSGLPPSRGRRHAVVIVVLGLAGCTAQGLDPTLDPGLDPGLDRGLNRGLNNTRWAPPRALGEGVESYRPPPSPAAAASIEGRPSPRPQGTITLRQAMALALAHHPDLQAFAWEVREAGARALQAGLGPNPELEAEFENFAGGGDLAGTRSLETTLSLAQTFPLGGDIERRRALADLRSQQAGWDYEAARLEVLTEVTRRYVELLAAQRRVALSGDALTLAERVRDATEKRIAAGDAPPIAAARAAVPMATARLDLRRAERQQEAARRRLALTWAARAVTFQGVEGALERLLPPPAPERLVALVSENPQVARWAVEISARRAEAALAQAEAIPDVTVRAGYRYDRAGDAGALVAGISLPLAIIDRRQGDVLAARLGEAAAADRRRNAERRVEVALSDAYMRLAAGYDEASAIHDEALPPATEAFELTRRAFEQGDVALIDLLDAERTLVELHSAYLDALTSHHLAVADIEGLIGRPLTGLDAAPHGANTRSNPEQP